MLRRCVLLRRPLQLLLAGAAATVVMAFSAPSFSAGKSFGKTCGFFIRSGQLQLSWAFAWGGAAARNPRTIQSNVTDRRKGI